MDNLQNIDECEKITFKINGPSAPFPIDPDPVMSNTYILALNMAWVDNVSSTIIDDILITNLIFTPSNNNSVTIVLPKSDNIIYYVAPLPNGELLNPSNYTITVSNNINSLTSLPEFKLEFYLNSDCELNYK